MNKIILAVTVFFCMSASFAQTQFIAQGKIEFERKVNLHKQFDENDSWSDMMKKTLPQYKTDYFDLYFDNNKTIYKPGREVAGPKIPDWFNGVANDNIVLNDLNNKTFISQKGVFESSFLIQDSLRKMDWKITNDTRTIAGFECRKATTIIMDSVFVVAFFTDQIVPPGGPESFTGLPGMILGIAIPRLSSTWFATKLELVSVKETEFAAPKKGKKTNIKDLNIQLKSSMKDWGSSADKNLWKLTI